MKIISVVCQKGGAGKTTIATNLAVLAERAGFPTVLFDLDPQATATKWGDKREGDTAGCHRCPGRTAGKTVGGGQAARRRPCDHRHRASCGDRRPRGDEGGGFGARALPTLRLRSGRSWGNRPHGIPDRRQTLLGTDERSPADLKD